MLKEQLLAERSRWILWLPVGLAIGIGWYFALPAEPEFSGFALSAGLATLAFVGRYRPFLFYPALIGMVIASGFGLAQWRTASVAAPVLQREVGPEKVTGTVREIQRRENSLRVVLEAVEIPSLSVEKTPARVRIKLMGGVETLRIGDRVRVTAKLMPVPRPALPGSYDFGRAMYFKRISAVGYTMSHPEELENCIGEECNNTSPWFMLEELRQQVTNRVIDSLEAPYGAIAAALMTGERGMIPESVYEHIRAAGLAHLLAISGLHLGMIAAILFFTVRLGLACSEYLALRYPIKKWAAVAALVGSAAYLAIAGFPVSARRAWVMVAFVLMAVMLDRTSTPVRFVAWAAVIILALEPESLLSAGFQLSFAATLALVAAYEALRGRFMPQREQGLMRKFGIYLGGILLSSLIATVATAPYTLHHFGYTSTYGLLANLLAIPVTTFWILPLALLSFGLMPLGLDEVTLSLMQQGIRLIVDVAEYVAVLPGSYQPSPRLPLWGVLLCTFGGLWLCFWETRWRYLGVLPFVMGFAGLAFQTLPDAVISKKSMAIYLADQRLVFIEGRKGSFETDVWQEAFQQERFWNADEVAPATDMLHCDKLGCGWRHKGRNILLLTNINALIEDCGRAEIVLARIVMPDRCAKERMINWWDVWRYGTHALYIEEEGLRIEHVQGERGRRPWSVER